MTLAQAPRASFSADGIHAEWDPLSRTFDCRFAPGADPPRARAADITQWTRTTAGGGPYAILLDGSNANGLSAGFRAAATKHLLAERDHVRVACYGLDPATHAIVDLITRITGANVRSFTGPAEAAQWLLSQLHAPLAAPHRPG